MSKYLLMILISFGLVACSTTKGTTVEVTHVTSYISVPVDKLVNVEVPPPPAKDLYVKMSGIEKEKALGDYAVKLLQVIYKANGIIDDIREWNTELLKKNELSK